MMTRADRIALVISIIAVIATYCVADVVFEGLPHLEDEIAYVWQAEAIANGRVTLQSPPLQKSFLIPFVVDYEGKRFGKYPLGWPALLGAGIALGLRTLINPLLAGIGVWLTYRLGKKIFSEAVGLTASVLTLTSPFFLMNSGTLLSHPFCLVLSAGFALAWLGAWENTYQKKWVMLITAGLALGILVITRPLSAVGVALPFAIHGLYMLVKSIRENASTREKIIHLSVFCAIVLAVSTIQILWQYVATGDPFKNLYTLWWPYDKVGFGLGFGHTDVGHNLHQAWTNTRHSLKVGAHDLFGWWKLSWIFIPFGMIASVRKPRAWLLAGVFPSLVLVYLTYWIGSSLFGPRYYYEGLYSLTLFSAAGVAYLAGWPVNPEAQWKFYKGWKRVRPLLVTGLLALLISTNILFYIPIRVGGLHGLYGAYRARLDPFLTEEAQELAPALIVVHYENWTEYGTFLELQDPLLTSPFIFVMYRKDVSDSSFKSHFPDRSVFHYYPQEPYRFYTAALPEP